MRAFFSGVMPGLICVLGRECADDLARARRRSRCSAYRGKRWSSRPPATLSASVRGRRRSGGLPGRAKEECNTCRGSKRPTLFRKASFLSSSKAALPGGLRLFARLRGKDSNLDYLIQSRPSDRMSTGFAGFSGRSRDAEMPVRSERIWALGPDSCPIISAIRTTVASDVRCGEVERVGPVAS
jgi:hypothetical protein